MLQHHAIAMQPYDRQGRRDTSRGFSSSGKVPSNRIGFFFQHLSGAIAAKRTDPTVILTVWAPRHEN